MTLREYYNSLSPVSPRTELVHKLLKATGKDRSTITRWLSGKAEPQSKLERELIESLTGIKLTSNDQQ